MRNSVRCLAVHGQDGTWLSLCLDLALVARATSLEDAQRQLTVEIRARLLKACPPGSNISQAHRLLKELPWHHRLFSQLLYWLAPLRRARAYRETLPFGVLA